MTSSVIQQASLNGGEIAPSLWGRTDLAKFKEGCSTTRNFFTDYRGGVKSRAGFAYVGTCKQQYPDLPPRDIPFQFNINQGYALEFGTEYMRVKSQGAYVSIVDEPDSVPHNITGITQANPAVITIPGSGGPGHGYVPGDWIYIYDVLGMLEFNGRTWIVNTVPTSTTLTVTDLYGNVIDSTAFPAYTSGGLSEEIFTLTTPYMAEDLPYIKYAQSADVMTLTCVNPITGTEYPPQTLTRLAQDNWTITPDTFGSTIQPPIGVVATAYSSTTPTTWYSYVITAVDQKSGEESNASHIANIQNNDISVYQGSNNISWTAVTNASSYNIYAAPPSYSLTTPANSVFGYIGTSLGPSYTDNNTTPDYTVVPPVHFDPFATAPIIDVIITAGGSNYSQDTVSWSVSSSFGTGFDGYPVVANGAIVGFVITNQGSGYSPSDTISFTDSGGGVAIGNYLVTSNATDATNLVINGYTLTFASEGSYKKPQREVLIGGDIMTTLQSTANFLNSNPLQSAAVSQASYSYDATHLYITYKLSGTVGNAYTLGSAPSGWTASGATLTGGGVDGSGATASLTIGPTTGTFPAVPAYYQQRRVYANSQNEPDTYWMSQSGLFSNMDTSIPVTDADSITGTPWSQQVNGIQFMVPMPGGLVVLTGKSAWQVNGGSQAAITPSNQTAIAQAYNGCNDIVQPLTINYDILYVQSKGSIARDLSYNFFTNIYTGTDLTVLSNHLFTFNTITQWCWCEEPFKLVWAVRDDGVLLCLTYLKEQEVYSWTRHDTNGMFLSVCSVTEPPVDALYVITQRFVEGDWRYYSERMNNRLWNTAEQSYCVDAGQSYPLAQLTPGLAYFLTMPDQNTTVVNQFSPPFYDSPLIADASTGTGINVSSVTVGSNDPFNGFQIGYIIRGGGGKMIITAIVDGNNATVDFLEDITEVAQDDPSNTPLPIPGNSWSISAPITTVTGLDHLNGLEVAILADGGYVGTQLVENGQIGLDQPASLITVGLPYTCQVQTLYLDTPAREGTSQNRRKTISALGVRVEATRGLFIGSDQIDASTQQNYATVPWENMVELKDRTASTPAGQAQALYTGDYYQAIKGGWTFKGQAAIQQTYPLPANILSVIIYSDLGDEK